MRIADKVKFPCGYEVTSTRSSWVLLWLPGAESVLGGVKMPLCPLHEKVCYQQRKVYGLHPSIRPYRESDWVSTPDVNEPALLKRKRRP